MSNLSGVSIPRNWAEVTLGKVATFEMGQAPAGSASNFDGNGTIFVKAGEFGTIQPVVREWTSEPKKFAREGDVLICVVGATAGKLNLAIDCAIGRSVAAIRPCAGVLQKAVYYQLLPNVEQMRANSTGSAQGVISQADLSKLVIRIPPDREQTRIVEKLEELLSDLDAGVAELKAAQRKLAQYRQSLLKAAVEGALTADWRATRAQSGKPQETGAALLQRILTERRTRWETRQLAKFAEQGKTPPKDWKARYPEPIAPDTTDLPALPKRWVWASVAQLSLVQKYGSSAKTNEESTGVPVLRMGNIQDGELDLGFLKYLPQDHHEFPDLFLDDGDIVFNRTNSPELVGKTAVFRSQITPCSYASYLIGVKLSPRCAPEFVSAYINSAYGRQWVKSVVTQQVGQANVNGSKLAALSVPLPPMDEQAEIARLLVEQRLAAGEQEVMIDLSLNQSAAQRKNILKAAFAGQLVPQDPNDEPASALLERIRAERAQLSAARGIQRTGSNRAPATSSPNQSKRGRKPRTTA